MNIGPTQDVAFDDEATLVMGAVFDQACESLRDFGRCIDVRNIIAKRIIKAAKNGERDPAQLYRKALEAFSIEVLSVPIARVDRDVPVPVYALIAQSA